MAESIILTTTQHTEKQDSQAIVKLRQYITYLFNRCLLKGAYWDDLRTPVSSIRIPAAGVFNPVETSYRSSYVLAFEDQAVNVQQVFWAWQLPHTYKLGTDMEAHIHTVPEDNTVGNVYWTFTYSVANKAGTFPVATSTSVVQAMPAIANYHQRFELAEISGTLITDISAMILCSLTRQSDNALDTFTAKDVYLLEADLHYKVDGLGTLKELTKL